MVRKGFARVCDYGDKRRRKSKIAAIIRVKRRGVRIKEKCVFGKGEKILRIDRHTQV